MIQCEICGCNDERLCNCHNPNFTNTKLPIFWDTNPKTILNGSLEITNDHISVTRSLLENNPLTDLVFAHWTNLYILGRISKEEMVNRLKASFPNVLDINLAELVEQVEEDKDRFLRGLKGEQHEKPIGSNF